MNARAKGARAGEFLADILRGAAIGIAFIIPGFSGGSVAVILGIYEKIVGSVADLFRHFLRSALALLPILLGAVLGAAAMIFPVRWGLEHFPIPTVTLFVGLAIGGLPAVKRKAPGKPTGRNLIAFALPCLLASLLAFLPETNRAEGFLYHLDFAGYCALFAVCALAACALVVPGISGSMLLLIFGYYHPLVQLLTGLVTGAGDISVLPVLAVAGLGIIAGLVGISALMKLLLRKFPRATYYAILGFLAGSIVAIYAPFARAHIAAPPWHWALAALLLFLGAALSLLFLHLAGRKKAEPPI